MKHLLVQSLQKSLLRGLGGLLLCLVLFSCSSDDDSGTGDNRVAVQFGTGNIALPKTSISDGETKWVAGDHIGIFMVGNGATSITGNIKENADNIQYKADNNAAPSSFSPVSGTPVYYPVNETQKVDFIAYYPYKTPLADHTYPVDVSNQTNPADIDVLYSNNATGYDKNSSTVDLQFKHALSKLEISVRAGIGAPDLTNLSVTIGGQYKTANLSLSDGNTFTDQQAGDIAMRIVTAATKYEAILIPQGAVSGSKATFKAGINTYDWDISGINFEPGKKYTYNITVDRTGITVTTGNITDWTGKDNNPTEGGAGYKVGDYYPDPTAVYNGGSLVSGTAAIGIVFWVDPADSRHGKIVGLKEFTGVWADNSFWNKQTDATDRDNGLNNMQTIAGYIGTTVNDASWSNFPAFNWVHSMNDTNEDYSDTDAKGVWYLPALNELQESDPNSLYNAYAVDKAGFNLKLTSVGGTALSSNWYWSSLEYGNYGAWFVDFNDGGSGGSEKLSFNVRARCVLSF